MSREIRITIWRLLIWSITVYHVQAIVPDLTVTGFDYTISAADFYQDIDIRIYFSITIKNDPVDCCPNIDPAIIPATNFAPQVIITDVDLSAGGVDSLSLPAVPITPDDPAVLRAGLANAEEKTIQGSSVFNIPSGDTCAEVRFLCVEVAKSSTASFSELTETNNFWCKNILSRMQCTDDQYDINVYSYQLANLEVHPGTSVAVDALLEVTAGGSLTLTPSTNPSHIYTMHLFLSTDDTLDADDLELIALPPSFDLVRTTDVSAGGTVMLDIGGGGAAIPDVQSVPELQKYCGHVRLIMKADGPTTPGDIMENDEENNVKVDKFMILCEGDRWSLTDFSYYLGAQQTALFITGTIPVWVNVTVHNTGDEAFKLNRADFKLSLWLHDSQYFMTGTPLKVSQTGVYYDGVVRSPMKGIIHGESIHITDAKFWLDGDVFTTPGYTHLILLAEIPDGGFNIQDRLQANNYVALPASVSSEIQLTDYKIEESETYGPFGIRQDALLADGTEVPVTKLQLQGNGDYAPANNDKLSFTGEVDMSSFAHSNMLTTLYWSKDDKWDTSDLESGIDLGILSTSPFLIMSNEQDALQPPTDKSYCGFIYGIVVLQVALSVNVEDSDKAKHNNFGVDTLLLNCDSSDIFGLTDLMTVDAPTLYSDVETPITLQMTISCTQADCSGFDNAQLNYKMKWFHVDDSDSETPLETINSNSDMIDYINDGLNADLTSRRAVVTVTSAITLTSALCNSGATHRLGVRILTRNNQEDSYTDNNFLLVDLPEPICDETQTMDIEGDEVILGGDSDLHYGEYMPFKIDFKVHLTGGLTLPQTAWPKLYYKLYITADKTLTGDYHVIQYEMPECHRQTLMEAISGAETDIRLTDEAGFYMPELLRFCGQTLYVGAMLDSYDPLLDDVIKGQWAEPLETNNMAWSQTTQIQYACSSLDTINQKLMIESAGPSTVHDVIYAAQEQQMSATVRVTNEHSEPIRGGTIQSFDFSVGVVLSGDDTKDAGDLSLRVTVDADDAHVLYAGLEAGGSAIFRLSAETCDNENNQGCTAANVLDESECNTLKTESPHYIIHLFDLTSGYTATATEAISLSNSKVRCGNSIEIELVDIFEPEDVTVDVEYKIPFTAAITHYNLAQIGGLFQTNEDNFVIIMRIDGATASAIELDDASILRSAIPAGDTITFTGRGVFQWDNSACVSQSDTPTLTMLLTSLHNVLTTNGYTAGDAVTSILAINKECSTDYIDATITDFSLLSTAGGGQTISVITLGQKHPFSLGVDVESSGLTGPANQDLYDVSFYIHSDDSPSPNFFTTPFTSTQTNQIRTALSNGGTRSDTLDSTDASDSLEILPAEAARFCGTDVGMVYITASVDTGDVYDPNIIDNVWTLTLQLDCPGDLFVFLSASSAGVTNLMAHDTFVLDVSLRIENAGDDEVPEGLNGQDNLYIELYTTGTDTRLDMVDRSVREHDSLRSNLTYGNVYTPDVTFTLDIDDTTCDEISSTGELLIKARIGMGFDTNYFDRWLENNEFLMEADCSKDQVDLYIDSVSILSLSGFDVNLQISGVVRLVNSGSVGDIALDLYLSHDDMLDDDDKHLEFDTSSFSVLTDGYTGSSGDTTTPVSISTDAGSKLTLPDDVTVDYCGRSYLIALFDGLNVVIEMVENNNFAAVPLTIKCDTDLYDVEVTVIEATEDLVFYAGQPSGIKFDMDVYNVKSAAVVADSPPVDNFMIKVYLQLGDRFDPMYAVDVTPSSLMFSDSSEEAAIAQRHESGVDPSDAITLTEMYGDVMATVGMCEAGLDHLMIGVMKNREDEDECLLYNNFYAHPIQCRIGDHTDLSVEIDRNDQPVFSLDSDNIFVIGEAKRFYLEVQVDVDGLGGWPAGMEGDPPMFRYSMELTDGSETGIIPVPDMTEEINKQTRNSRIIDLSGEVVLPPALFSPLCNDGWDLVLTLDSGGDIVESNEWNNRLVISPVTLEDDGTGVCNSGLDIVATGFEVLPMYTEQVESTSSLPTYDFQFIFEVLKGSTASNVNTFDYELVMSPDMNPDHPMSTSVRGASGSHSVSGNTATVNHAITTEQVTDRTNAFCGTKAYLGIFIDSGDDWSELDETNNYAWQQIILSCPNVEAIALQHFELIDTDQDGVILDGAETVIDLSLVVINKGETIDSAPGNHFEFEAYLINGDDIDSETALSTVSFSQIDSPDRSDEIIQNQVLDYFNAKMTVTITRSECLDKTHLCVNVLPQSTVNDRYTGDNFICLDVTTGPVRLDCARDIELDQFFATMTGATFDQEEIYQDTDTRVLFTVRMTFSGSTIPAYSSPSIGFDMYVSDQDDITPSALNSGNPYRVGRAQDVEQRGSVIDTLSGAIADGDQENMAGNLAMINIPSAVCDPEGESYLCVTYVVLQPLTPPMREFDTTNDFVCMSMQASVTCSDETKDLSIDFIGFPPHLLRVTESVNFDLYVKVDLRGLLTAGAVTFETIIFISTSTLLDDAVGILNYGGLTTGQALQELQRDLPLGVSVLSLAGSPAVIPDGVICGRAYFMVYIDFDEGVQERYETNNQDSTVANIQCPGDVFQLHSLVLDIPEPLVSLSFSVISVSAVVQNMGDDLPSATPHRPHYTLTVFASDDLDPAAATLTDITGHWEQPEMASTAMKTGMEHHLHDVMGMINMEAFTYDICQSTVALLVCVTTTYTDDVTDDDCDQVPIMEDDKHCQDDNRQRDLMLENVRIPPVFPVPGPITVTQDMLISMASQATPLSPGAFISSLYLTPLKEWPGPNSRHVHKLADIPNEIAQGPGTVKLRRTVTRDLPIEAIPDEFCGRQFAVVVVDSDDDVIESSEDNAVSRPVSVLCENDFFGLGNVEFETEDGYVLDLPTRFDLSMDVTCTKSNCAVDMADENVKFALRVFDNDTTEQVELLIKKSWVVAADPDVEWMSPSLGIDFSEPGITRTFHVTGAITLPPGTCGDYNKVQMELEVFMGSSLSQETDDLPDNNVFTWNYPCGQMPDLDLIAHPAILPGGTLIDTTQPVKFKLPVELKDMAIPPYGSTLTASPFTFAFFACDEPLTTQGCVRLTYELSDSVKGDLIQGLSQDSTTELVDYKNGFMVPEGICGAGFLTVLLDDTQRTMDTYRSNNVASLRVHYKCPQDALAVTSVEFTSPALVWPDEIYQVTFGMTVRNTGSTDMMFAPDSKVFVLSASLSETGEYDTGTSIPLNVTLNYQDLSRVAAMGIPMGGEVTLTGHVVDLMTDSDRCASHQLIHLGALMAEAGTEPEMFMKNNFMSASLNMQCEPAVDMMVTAFDIAPDLEPDLEVDFSLTVDVSVDDGGATVPFLYEFWLSHDTEFDRDLDYPLSYTVPSDSPTLSAISSSSSIDLGGSSGAGTQLMVFNDLDTLYCGMVYVLVVLDPQGRVIVKDPTNKVAALQKLMSCDPTDELMSIASFALELAAGDMAPLHDVTDVNIDVTIQCVRTDLNCPGAGSAGENHYVFDLEVYDESGWLIGMLDPSTINDDSINNNGYVTFNPDDGLRKDFSGAIKSHPLTMTVGVELVNKSACHRVRYAGLSMRSGESTAMAGRDVGPPGPHTRMTPFRFNCDIASVELRVEAFDLAGGATEIDVADGLFLSYDLDVSITASNWPEPEDGAPAFKYQLYLSNDDTITVNDTVLNVVPSEDKAYLLDQPLIGADSLTLSETALEVPLTPALIYCGKTGVHLGIILDPLHLLPEESLENNFRNVPVTITGCRDGLHVWLRELALPSIAQSDEYVPVSAKLSIMEVIDGEISVPSDMTYSLTMTLVDEMENPEHEFPLDYARDLAVPVSDTMPTLPDLHIPPHTRLAEKAWYVKVKVVVSDLEANVTYADDTLYHSLYISRPVDQLALYSVEVTHIPAVLWSEAEDVVYVDLTVVNYGDDVTATLYPDSTVFSIKQYLSMDDVLDGDDANMDLWMPEGHLYDHRQNIEHGEMFETGRLTGLLHVDAYSSCLDVTQDVDARPTLFWRLEVVDGLLSTFLANDVLSLPLDTSMFRCEQVNVDLRVYEIVLSPEPIITVGVPIRFNVTLRQTRTSNGLIPGSDKMGTELSMDVAFYLSVDEVFSADDVMVGFPLSTEQRHTLQHGVDDETAEYFPFEGTNLMIDLEDQPELRTYCGRAHLVVMVTDLINDPSIDPIHENNDNGIPIDLICSGDLLGLQEFALEPVAPQKQLFENPDEQYVFFTLKATVKNFAMSAISPNSAGNPNINFRVFLSYDEHLDVLLDPEVKMMIVHLPGVSDGLEAEETKEFEGLVSLWMQDGTCTFQPRFLMLYAEKGSEVLMEEPLTENNMLYKPVQDLVNCSISLIDIEVLIFGVESTPLLPGESSIFNLTVKVFIQGRAELGSDTEDAFGYKFFLSDDMNWDDDDIDLGYQGMDQPSLVGSIKAGSHYFWLNSETEELGMPLDIRPEHCGSSYIIAVMDHNNVVIEIDEINNQFAARVVVNCYGDLLELKQVTVLQQDVHMRAPASIVLSDIMVSNLGQNDLDDAEDFNISIVDLKLYVQLKDQPMATKHDITPLRWYDFLKNEFWMWLGISVGGSRGYSYAKGDIDLTEPCRADVDTLITGEHTLYVEISPGISEQLIGQYDMVPENNVYTTNINVDCDTTNTIDLELSDDSQLSVDTGRITLGSNLFTLSVGVHVQGSGGWEIQPSLPGSPMMFTYSFQMISWHTMPDTGLNTPIIHNVMYDATQKKEDVNDQTIDGRDIDLSDDNYGLLLPIEDYFLLCTADKIELSAIIDTLWQVDETNEGNNRHMIELEPPSDGVCGNGRDIDVTSFAISGLAFDTVVIDEPMITDVRVRLVLTGTQNVLDGLEGTGLLHFNLTYFLSDDDQFDDGIDYIVPAERTQEQIDQLQLHITDLAELRLGQPDVVIPLNDDTFHYCWRPVYVGVIADMADQLTEINNEDNNMAVYTIKLDCGDEVDECARGFDDCHVMAQCWDDRHTLYSPPGQGYHCVCNHGYAGDGVTCTNIDECTEVDSEGNALHHCDPMLHTVCDDSPGHYSCICDQGYEESIDSMGQTICINTNECDDDDLNMCDEFADCQDLDGSYSCSCMTGFSGDGMTCDNIDDCAVNPCLSGGSCEDAIDAYICHCEEHHGGDTCEIANGNWGEWSAWGDCLCDCGPSDRTRQRFCDNPSPVNGGKNCPGINGTTATEYEICPHYEPCPSDFGWCNVDLCDSAAGGLCCPTNQGQSYTCLCRAGYIRLPTSGVFKRCQDINECTEVGDFDQPLHDCDVLATCDNTLGGYTCTCFPGFEGDGQTCEDVNECLTEMNQCGANAECVNEAGNFRCECDPHHIFPSGSDPMTSHCIYQILLEYGEDIGDELVDSVSRVTQERVSHLIPITHGLTVGDKVYQSLYISENGLLVAVDDPLDDLWKPAYAEPHVLSTLDQSTGALFAAWWADMRTENTSEIWHKVYTSTADIPGRVFELLDDFYNVTSEEFTPLFGIKVTWKDMMPVYSALENELVTFQAVLVTDYVQTYVIYLYGEMTWRPVYSALELQKYGGYPARVGYVAHMADGGYQFEENPHSAKWSMDGNADSLNAYRIDSKLLMPNTDVGGVVIYRVDTAEEGFINPRQHCIEWYKSEPGVMDWSDHMTEACPSMAAQAVVDKLLQLEPQVGSNPLCFSTVFTQQNGASARCCYEADDILITADSSGSTTWLQEYADGGFTYRYPLSSDESSNHQMYDEKTYYSCCIDNPLMTEYCMYYLERRPASKGYNYNKPKLGFVRGLMHVSTLDGLQFTFSGFGEYVLLQSLQGAEHDVKMQIRTRQIESDGEAQARTTYLSGVAVSVSDSPMVEVYFLKGDLNPVRLWLDGADGVSFPYAQDNLKIEEGDDQYTILFEEGIYLEIEVGDLMQLTVGMTKHLQTGQYTGLLGNFDAEPSNDLTSSSGGVVNTDTATLDDEYGVGRSYSLIFMFGTSSSGSNANMRSLFSQYGGDYVPEGKTEANLYYDRFYTPSFPEDSDYTADQLAACLIDWLGGSLPECLYDVYMADDMTFAEEIKAGWEGYTNVLQLLGETSPEFTANTDRSGTIHLNEEFTLQMELYFPGFTPDVTAMIHDSDGVEMTPEPLLTTEDRGNDLYMVTLTWTATAFDVYDINVKARSEGGSAYTRLRPAMVVCACQNGGVCDTSKLWKPEHYVGNGQYGGCICGPGRSGPFCQEDYPACQTDPCYDGGCQDLEASEVLANADGKEFTCPQCPSNMQGDGETCTDLDECSLPMSDPRYALCNQTCVNTAGSYICECHQGFTMAKDGLGCVDDDECATSADNRCDHTQGYCTNTPGSYECHCNRGYRLTADYTCVDDDECLQDNGDCAKICINTPGSYECRCPSGYLLGTDTRSCTDVNECEIGGTCAQGCLNIVGGFTCTCDSGFILQGTECVPENPCTLNCGAPGVCGIIDSVAKCFCPQGYQVSPENNMLCDDTNECTQGLSGCGGGTSCHNTIGGYTCECLDGYQPLSTSAKECTDINECLTSSNGGCGRWQQCVNTMGSHSCVCLPGFKPTEDGTACVDYNECLPGAINNCDLDADCHNLNGSYYCTCHTGYTGSGYICIDQNECVSNTNLCSEVCINVVGGYMCSCLPGMRTDPMNPAHCIDVNECELPDMPCSHTCVNTQGSYYCTCPADYTLTEQTRCVANDPCQVDCGSGGVCVNKIGTRRCECYTGQGFRKNPGELDRCNDYNECDQNADNRCHFTSRCDNQIGGYRCVCDAGYETNLDQISCSDVDECTTLVESDMHSCDVISTTCQNTLGGYTCNCRPGFDASTSSKSCEDVDECELRIDDCARRSHCTNLPGTYICTCDAGYTGDGKTCIEINECNDWESNECSETETCVDDRVGYHCECKHGYKRDLSTNRCDDINECVSPVLNECGATSGCVNTPGSYRCTCYDGAVLENDGHTCSVVDHCLDPSRCKQVCVRSGGRDTCQCRSPLTPNCEDTNECASLPCDTLHSTCVNKNPMFECECDTNWLPAVDGLSCPETDGLWAAWSNYTVCSKSCAGRQMRVRACTKLRPAGEDRACAGDGAQYKMCEVKGAECAADPQELESGIFVDLPDTKPEMWETIEDPYLRHVITLVNNYLHISNATYEEVCGKLPPVSGIPRILVTLEDIHVGLTYPRTHENGTRVLVVLAIRVSDLCGVEVTARKRRDVTGVELDQHHARYERSVNDTYYYVDQETFMRIMRQPEAMAMYLKELAVDDLDLVNDYLTSAVHAAFDEDVTPPPTVPTPAPDDDGLPVWAIALIVVGAIILLVIIVILIYCQMRNIDGKTGRVSPNNSEAALDGEVDASEYKDETIATAEVVPHHGRHTHQVQSRPVSAVRASRQSLAPDEAERGGSPLPGQVDQADGKQPVP